MTSRSSDCQRNLPPMELENDSAQGLARTKDSPASPPSMAFEAAVAPRTNDSAAPVARTNHSDENPCTAASVLVDECITDARLDSKVVAQLCGVTTSLVNRWRSSNYDDSPSLAHLLRLPAGFHWALVKRLIRRFAFGQRAIAEAVETQGVLAVVVGR